LRLIPSHDGHEAVHEDKVELLDRSVARRFVCFAVWSLDFFVFGVCVFCLLFVVLGFGFRISGFLFLV
jgi:hypothetical protein